MNRKEALEIIKSVLRKVVPNAEVILYGSEARGEARQDSDFDILILEDSDSISISRRKEITYPLLNLFYEYGIDVQPLVKTRKQWENIPCKTPFYLNVMNEGIRI